MHKTKPAAREKNTNVSRNAAAKESARIAKACIPPGNAGVSKKSRI
jgi:hypothetical protein